MPIVKSQMTNCPAWHGAITSHILLVTLLPDVKLNPEVSFKTYFRLCSYAMIAVATLSLVWAGALHLVLGAVFCAALVLSWRLEGGTWQLSERTGLILVLLSVPIFYLDWSYQAGARFIAADDSQTQALVGAIAHLITALSAIKLFQVKSDRDWVFLYLISFFEILLAAGLSFSPVY